MRKTNQRLRMPFTAFWTALMLTASILGAPARMYSQDRSQGRSMVISRYGIVAAESPLAAQAGVQMLEHGGNAVDAAVAANAMMGVVAPMSNGIGGDLFAIVYDAKSGKLYGLNASGWAPAGLTIDFLKKQGLHDMPGDGIYSVTVPGAVDGWQKLLDRFGKKKIAGRSRSRHQGRRRRLSGHRMGRRTLARQRRRPSRKPGCRADLSPR